MPATHGVKCQTRRIPDWMSSGAETTSASEIAFKGIATRPGPVPHIRRSSQMSSIPPRDTLAILYSGHATDVASQHSTYLVSGHAFRRAAIGAPVALGAPHLRVVRRCGPVQLFSKIRTAQSESLDCWIDYGMSCYRQLCRSRCGRLRQDVTWQQFGGCKEKCALGSVR